ncbi:hypothetical protein HU200_016630 [Digitaria exilis]|uniref:BHLH domain-containing protein n=1 Tax=Digitaria exilis TaxID=1010633 RepID=A0A835KKK9_9POAL|nr:hypothetical protein HU200_016630 [Digitaria exilis]
MYQQGEHAGMHQLLQDPQHPSDPTLAMSGGFQRFGSSAPALPNLSFAGAAAVTVKNEQGQPSSSSIIFSFGALPVASTINSSGGGDWAHGGGAMEGVVPQEPAERRSRSQLTTPEHVAAERRRREKMQQQFVALANMVPDLTKSKQCELALLRIPNKLLTFCISQTDKISILGSTIQYVKQLEEKVKTLEKQSSRRISSQATVLEGKDHISLTDSQETSCPSGSNYGVGSSIPTVEATIHDDIVLLRICCERRSGILVMIISELERMELSIMNTSVMPFSDSYFSINITAKASIPYPPMDLVSVLNWIGSYMYT